jgi:hypothetical protein
MPRTAVAVERPAAILHQPVPALEDADDIRSVLPRSRDDAANHRVKPGAIPSRREKPDAHHVILGAPIPHSADERLA